VTVRVRVRAFGRVQGVSFRYSALQRATSLGLAGWIRNNPDGSVEAEVQGPENAVDGFVTWMGEGPSGARVERTEEERIPLDDGGDFRVTG
jgi:acylphosphatase